MDQALVPETAIDEDCQFELGKYKIRFAKHRLIAPPARDAVESKKAEER